ncbi:hypothetical protein [Pengzhenrongella sp.]|jgi:hypothetical protein|uniref:PH-like domain-containing protein n=1 Tax=Pengzhenrongella sp. TaxID=2888820 RepID=UPI002F91D0A2
MPPAVTAAILTVLVLGVLAAMFVGWRHRAQRTGLAVPELPAVPARDDAALGEPRTESLAAIYVSTTTSGDWLDRIVAHDLGARSGAVVRVFDAGIRIERHGARDLFIPADAVRGVGTAPGMAGKVVGGHGLVVVTWQAPGPGAVLLDTGLRLRRGVDRTPLTDAVGAFVPADQNGADELGASTKEST